MIVRRGVLSLAALLGGVNAACLDFRPPPPPLPREASGSPPPERWRRQVGRALSGSAALDASGNTVFVGGFDRKLTALALDSAGEARWTRRFSGSVQGGVHVAGGTLYLATGQPDGRVYALDARNGHIRWQQTAVAEVSLPVTLADNLLIAQTDRGEVVALDTARGTIRWKHGFGVGRAPPLADSAGSVLVTTVDSVFRLSAATGRVLAHARTPGSVVAPWVRAGGLLVGASTDSLLLGLDPATLHVRWRARLDAPNAEAPVLLGDTVWAVTRIGSLYRLPLAATATDTFPVPERVRALRWPVTAPLVALGDLLLLGGADGTIRALRHDGSQVWRIGLWSPVEIAPVPLHDGFLAVGGNADVHRYGP